MKAWNKKTHEEFLKDLERKHIQYRPVGKYIDSQTKIDFQCNECGNVWEAEPTNILSGRGCPECKRMKAKMKFLKTHEQFLQEASKENPGIEILGEYQGWHFPVMVACKKHREVIFQIPSSTLRGCGCSQCMKERIALKNKSTVEHFMKRATAGSPYLEVLNPEEYENARTKMEVRCRIHGNTFRVAADAIAVGTASCPVCAMTKGEHAVAMYLDEAGYEYITQYDPEDSELGKRRFDFYIPEENVMIEYDGAQHFIPVGHWGGDEGLKITQQHDFEKDAYCKRNGINLIRIPYTVKDIERFLSARLPKRTIKESVS